MSERHDAAVHAGVAAPGTICALHNALKTRLNVVAAGLPRFETKTSARAPSVIGGWLPPKPLEGEQFPFLIVRPRAGEDTEQGADENASASFDIIIGTYSDTDDGWFDVLLLVDAIRDDLLAQPTIEGTAYEHFGPLRWEIPEQQPRPQWFGTVTTNWRLPRPRRVEARNPTQED